MVPKANLGVDLAELEEVAVHDTSASRVELCSSGDGSSSSSEEHQISCSKLARLKTIDLRGNKLTSLGDLRQLPAIQELRISGEWKLDLRLQTSKRSRITYSISHPLTGHDLLSLLAQGAKPW